MIQTKPKFGPRQVYPLLLSSLALIVILCWARGGFQFLARDLYDIGQIKDSKHPRKILLQTAAPTRTWEGLKSYLTGPVSNDTCANIDSTRGTCQDRAPAGDCVVYSFKQSGSWELDKGMGKQGCEVHVYDHGDAPLKAASQGVTYHRLALADVSNRTDAATPRATLCDVIEENGHSGRTIDLLRIDCDGCEWTALDEIVTKGCANEDLPAIQQIVIDVHLADPAHVRTSEDLNRVDRLFNFFLQNEYRIFFRREVPAGDVPHTLLPELRVALGLRPHYTPFVGFAVGLLHKDYPATSRRKLNLIALPISPPHSSDDESDETAPVPASAQP